MARHFKGMVSGVERFELPNLNALNFLLHDALDGGGTISLKTDAQGKVYSTALLRMEIPVPAALARRLGRADRGRPSSACSSCRRRPHAHARTGPTSATRSAPS